MVRAYVIFALALGLATATRASPARAQTAQPGSSDPFGDEGTAGATSGSAGGSAAGSAAAPAAGSAASDIGVVLPAEGAIAPATDEPPVPAGCEEISGTDCRDQTSTLLLMSGGYVIIAVLLFSLLRLWWDKRGTNTAGVRFVSTLLPAASLAGELAYLDPMRSQTLACCIRMRGYAGYVLLQDSDLGRAALLGFVPAAALFVIVAIIVKAMRS